MVELIDKRGRKLTDRFCDLEIGQCYQDTENYICMKVGRSEFIRYIDGKWGCRWIASTDELVIPLKTTITIERCDK
jgi:hypothetical protein